jgi:hypothetical protein
MTRSEKLERRGGLEVAASPIEHRQIFAKRDALRKIARVCGNTKISRQK